MKLGTGWTPIERVNDSLAMRMRTFGTTAVARATQSPAQPSDVRHVFAADAEPAMEEDTPDTGGPASSERAEATHPTKPPPTTPALHPYARVDDMRARLQTLREPFGAQKMYCGPGSPRPSAERMSERRSWRSFVYDMIKQWTVMMLLPRA